MSEQLAQLKKKGSTEKFAKGSFVSSSVQNGIVSIDLGFKPKHISCWFAFVGQPMALNKVMTVMYDEDLSLTQSRWVLGPVENNTFYNTLGSGSGETGISNVTDNGFEFRSFSANCRGVVVNYFAY